MEHIEVEVVEKGFVPPAKETPENDIWLSSLDLIQVGNNTPTVLVFRPPPDGSVVDFFSVDKIKSAMSEALVPFYPLAGRLVVRSEGDVRRHEIRCTGEGVYYVVARCASTLDDLGNLTPSPAMRNLLVPSAKTGEPPGVLFMFQVTFFKCGGVCMGTWINHCAADGLSTLCFINTWANIARGVENKVNLFFDRTVLRARSPPTVTYDQIEHQLKRRTRRESSATEVARLKISKEQLAFLKNKGRRDGTVVGNLTTFEAVMAHVWRCACMARQLEGRERTRIYMTADARSRLSPPLPAGYFGNAIIRTAVTATVDEILSNPTRFASERIREATARLNDEYVRSVVDYFELLVEDAGSLLMGSVELTETDLWAISWLKLPVYETDFGWGRPALMIRAQLVLSGMVYIIPNADEAGDGGVSVVVGLETTNMARFKNMFRSELEVDAL